MRGGAGGEGRREEEEGRNDTYLSGTSLGKIGDEVDLFGRSERPNDFSDLEGELLGQGELIIGVISKLTNEKQMAIRNIVQRQRKTKSKTHGLSVTNA